VVRQSPLIAVVGAFLVAVVVVGCAGVRSKASQEEQAHIEATTEQARSDRCEGTRTFKKSWGLITTNDIPGCPYGGLLIGTDGREDLQGRLGKDEIHGLGGRDYIEGGGGNDIIYGGPGDDACYRAIGPRTSSTGGWQRFL
jgi:RTX calcium-binding nonapeptide repeat (4 copies)